VAPTHRIKITPGALLVDGTDISQSVRETYLTMVEGSPVKLGVVLVPDVEIEVDGVVEIIREAPGGDDREAVLAFLEAIDVETLTQEALASLDMGGPDPITAAIEKLKEYVRDSS
jgi:hypothetical protein